MVGEWEVEFLLIIWVLSSVFDWVVIIFYDVRVWVFGYLGYFKFFD